MPGELIVVIQSYMIICLLSIICLACYYSSVGGICSGTISGLLKYLPECAVYPNKQYLGNNIIDRSVEKTWTSSPRTVEAITLPKITTRSTIKEGVTISPLFNAYTTNADWVRKAYDQKENICRQTWSETSAGHMQEACQLVEMSRFIPGSGWQRNYNRIIILPILEEDSCDDTC